MLSAAIDSVLENNPLLGELEICISNNCSDSDYSDVEKKVRNNADKCEIKYFRQPQRLSIDENHHYVKSMGCAEYVYYLGDDDYFLSGQIQKLIEFIKVGKPDLAIFNGRVVDEKNKFLRMHLNLSPMKYESFENAFNDLRAKGMFGAILVRAELLNDEDFKVLYGTSHAYGCYWLSILRKIEHGEKLNIYIPEFPCVALRCARKNYNHISIYYKDIPYEMEVYNRNIGNGRTYRLHEEFSKKCYKQISSVKFLCSLCNYGYDLKTIKSINLKFYRKNEIKIRICIIICSLKVVKMIRKLYRCVKSGQKNNSENV
jgi:hypothetical protein